MYDLEKESKPEIFSEDDFIELRNVGSGSSSSCVLNYHIQRGELCVMKKIHINNSSEANTLIERETSNYSEVSHPFLPKFYGTIKETKSIVIEFIKGKTLEEIKSNLTYQEKMTILFELMVILDYFNSKNLIYRDLKPNNIMIDENKSVILIDFDRLINKDTQSKHTLDFQTKFVDPEINETHKFSIESDIYSLGMIYYDLMNQTQLKVKKKKRKN